MAKTIRLNSRHLNPGDKLIRIKPLYTNGVISNSSWTDGPVTVVKKHPYHLEVTWGNNIPEVLPFYKWDDGYWTRWK